MEKSQKDITTLLKSLFNDAQTNGGIDYIYTLVRVEGITRRVPDPLLKLQSELKATKQGLKGQSLLSRYCLLANFKEPFYLIANLINCTRKQPYRMDPFQYLNSGQFPNIIKPTLNTDS